MKNFMILGALVAVFSLSYTYGGSDSSHAKERAQEMSHDAKRGVKQAGRDIDDSTCELRHGKAECAAKKGAHSVQKGADKVEDAVD
jgi:hypothetical protein